jgi:hypothetical protein
MIPAVAVVLSIRAAEGGQRTLALAIAELAIFVVASIAATVFLERTLLREVLGYLRGRDPSPLAAP